MTDEEWFSVDDNESLENGGEYDVLTAEERMQLDAYQKKERTQLDSALHRRNSDVLTEDEEHGVQDSHENGDGGSFDSSEPNGSVKEKKTWFDWNKRSSKHGGGDREDSKAPKKFSDLAPEGSNPASQGRSKIAF